MKNLSIYLLLVLIFLLSTLLFSLKSRTGFIQDFTGRFIQVTQGNYTLVVWSSLDETIPFKGSLVKIFANYTLNGQPVQGDCNIIEGNETHPMVFNQTTNLYEFSTTIKPNTNLFLVKCGNTTVTLAIKGYPYTFSPILNNYTLESVSQFIYLENNSMFPNFSLPFERKILLLNITDDSKPQKIILNDKSISCDNLTVYLSNSSGEFARERFVVTCDPPTILFKPLNKGEYYLILYESNETQENNLADFLCFSEENSWQVSLNDKVYQVRWINSSDFVTVGGDYSTDDYMWRISLYDKDQGEKWEYLYNNEQSGDSELPFDATVFNDTIVVVGFDRELNPEINFYYFRWIILALDFSGRLKWKYNYTSTKYVQSDQARAVDVDENGNIYVAGNIGNPTGWMILILSKNGTKLNDFTYKCGSRGKNIPHSISVSPDRIVVVGRCDSGTPTGWLNIYNKSTGDIIFSENSTSQMFYDVKFKDGFLWDIAYSNDSKKMIVEKRALNGSLLKQVPTDLDGSLDSPERIAALKVDKDFIYISGYYHNPTSNKNNPIVEIFDKNLTLVKEYKEESYSESSLNSIDVSNQKEILSGGYLETNWYIKTFSLLDSTSPEVEPVNSLSVKTKKVGGKFGKWLEFSSSSNKNISIMIYGDKASLETFTNQTVELPENNTWIQIELKVPSNFTNEIKINFTISVSQPFQLFLGNNTVESNGRIFARENTQLPIFLYPDKTTNVTIFYFSTNHTNITSLELRGNSNITLLINFSSPTNYVLFLNSTLVGYGNGSLVNKSLSINGSKLIEVKKDVTPPNISLNISSQKITLGESVNTTCIIEDDVYLLNYSLYAIKNNEIFPMDCNSSFKPPESGTYLIILKASDLFFNVSVERQLVVESTEKSAAYPKPSGGFPSTLPHLSSMPTEKEAQNLTKNETELTTVEVTYIDLRDLKLISIGAPIKIKKVYQTSEDIETFVTKTLPKLLEKIKIYTLLEIEAKEEPKKAIIYFNVSKEWLRKNNIKKDEIVVYEVRNDSMIKLNTSIIGETEKVIEYKAFTKGFSYIVIGALKSSTNTSTEEKSFPSYHLPTQEAKKTNYYRNFLVISVFLILMLISVLCVLKTKKRKTINNFYSKNQH